MPYVCEQWTANDSCTIQVLHGRKHAHKLQQQPYEMQIGIVNHSGSYIGLMLQLKLYGIR